MARARGLMVCVRASDEKRRVRADSLKRVIFVCGKQRRGFYTLAKRESARNA
jgi:hypothetical protein